MLNRVARPVREALRTRCLIVQYGEGLRGKPADRRSVVAADRLSQHIFMNDLRKCGVASLTDLVGLH